jgi:hypothetical protein
MPRPQVRPDLAAGLLRALRHLQSDRRRRPRRRAARPPRAPPALQEQIRRIDAQIAARKAQLDAATPELAAAQERWERDLRGPSDWVALEPLSARSEAGASLTVQPDRSVRADGTLADRDAYTITARTDLKGPTAFRLESLPDPALPGGGAGRGPDGAFVLSRFAVEAAPADPTGDAPTGRFVRVEIPGEGKILSLAEVQVFSDGRNVARAGAARQSSTDYDGPAALAIDGTTDGDYFAARSTTHTRTEADPWWEVRLAEPRAIERIAVWNRTDGGVGVRLSQFRVRVLDDARRVVWQAEVAEPPPPAAR